MVTYQGFNRQAFERSSATTLANYVREVDKEMLRGYMFLALLEEAGRVTYNHSGEGIVWSVQYRTHDIEGNTGQTPRNYARRNLWKQAATEWRGYQATDMMYEKEFQTNKGPEGIVKVFDGMIDRLMESMKQGLSRQFFNDGSASGNEDLWEGLETLFGATQTININTGAARTANQADKCAYPNTTYAQIQTTLGQYGGDNEPGEIWPNGVADPQYDFWTPVIVLYNSTAFSGASQTFLAQGEEAMRFAMLSMERNGQLAEQMTQWWLGRNLYQDHLQRQDNRQEIQVQSNYTVRALGFKSTQFDGVEVAWEPSTPSNRGYGWSWRNVELQCLESQFLKPEGPEYDMDTQAYKAVVSTLSNFKYKSPRKFAKLTKHDDLSA